MQKTIKQHQIILIVGVKINKIKRKGKMQLDVGSEHTLQFDIPDELNHERMWCKFHIYLPMSKSKH